MAALSEARNTRELLGGRMSFQREVATSKTVYAGSMVAQNSSGKVQPAADAASTTILGRAANSATAGENVTIEAGVFLFDNGTSSEALAATDIGKVCFALDDHTVGKVGGSHKAIAGIVTEVTSEGVWVAIIGCAPIAPGAAVTNCTPVSSSATSCETQLNALLASLRAAGVITA